MDELLLREPTPAVIGILVRRGVDTATERAGDLPSAARLYAAAARSASNLAERDHLTRQAARLHHALRG